MNNTQSTDVRHVSEEDLLLLLDGELGSRAAERAEAHLEGCWTCRARCDALRAAITRITRVRNDMLAAPDERGPRSWSSLDARFDEADLTVTRSPIARLVAAFKSRSTPVDRRWAGVLTATAVVLAVVWWAREPEVSAAELLTQSALAATPAATEAVHRTVQLEERQLPDRRLLAARRIEVWHSAPRGLITRRIFDDRRLVAGEWRRDDGTATRYRAGVPPQIGVATKAGTPDRPATLETVWTYEPSARDFALLVGDSDGVSVERRKGTYILSFSRDLAAGQSGLVAATLVLTGTDLHATEQSLVVRDHARTLEYRFIEATFERVPATDVSPRIFEVDAALLAAPLPPAPVPVAAISEAPRRVEPAATTSALDAETFGNLELSAWFRLHALGLCLDEEFSISRNATGGMSITAGASNDAGRAAIASALASFESVPAVSLNVTTRPAAATRPSSEPGGVALEMARRHFVVQLGQGGTRSTVNEATVNGLAQQFARLALERSGQALRHAVALETLVNRWSTDALVGRDLRALTQWQSMVREHAQEYGRETASLRVWLQPVLFTGLSPDDLAPEPAIGSIADVPAMVARLMALARDQHAFLQDAFGPSRNELDPLRLWRVIRKGETLAAAFSEPWVLGR